MVFRKVQRSILGCLEVSLLVSQGVILSACFSFVGCGAVGIYVQMYIAIVAAVSVVRVSLYLLPKLISMYTAFTFNSYFFTYINVWKPYVLCSVWMKKYVLVTGGVRCRWKEMGHLLTELSEWVCLMNIWCIFVWVFQFHLNHTGKYLHTDWLESFMNRSPFLNISQMNGYSH